MLICVPDVGFAMVDHILIALASKCRYRQKSVSHMWSIPHFQENNRFCSFIFQLNNNLTWTIHRNLLSDSNDSVTNLIS